MYRMSRKTSIYINPHLEKLLDANPQPIPEALYRGLAVRPLLIQHTTAGYRNHWYCPNPGEGVKYIVLSDHWIGFEDHEPIREIYEIEVVPSEA